MTQQERIKLEQDIDRELELEGLIETCEDALAQINSMEQTMKFPTENDYKELGELFFSIMLEDLSVNKHFITLLETKLKTYKEELKTLQI